MKDTIKEILHELALIFDRQGVVLYAVGDYVANEFLGLPCSFVEVCSVMPPEAVAPLCAKNSIKCNIKQARAGVLTLCMQKEHMKLHLRHTTLRKIDQNTRKLTYSGSLETDALCRSVTVGALYKNLITGEVSDPTGMGRADLESKLLRSTTDPDFMFSLEPIRIMRIARFAAEMDFSIDTATFEAARRNVALLSEAGADCIRDELFKSLIADVRYPEREYAESPVLRVLLLLREMDVFSVILPEFEEGRNVEQHRRYHIYDVQEHMIHAAAAIEPELKLRVAALFHDIGKPQAYAQNMGKNMHGHDKIGALIARSVLTRLGCSPDKTSSICRLIYIHMYDIAGTAKENALRAKFALWGEDTVESLIKFRRADVIGSGSTERSFDSANRFAAVLDKMRSEGVVFSIHDLKISRNDIAGVLGAVTNKQILDAKRYLLRHCAVFPADNEREKLIEVLRTMPTEADTDTAQKSMEPKE